MQCFITYLLAIFSAVVLIAAIGDATALPLPIAAGIDTHEDGLQPIFVARAGHKASKKASSSKARGKQPAAGPPGPPAHQTLRPLRGGQPLRQDGPRAWAVDPTSRWKVADKKDQAFLDPNSKAGTGDTLRKSLQLEKVAGTSHLPLYGQDKKDESDNDKDIRKMTTGRRIDRQGNQSNEQDFNVQAQTNGENSRSFAACVGWKECGADHHDILDGLQQSAQEGATVHLVSQDWRPQE
jgi:hypothetical protein